MRDMEILSRKRDREPDDPMDHAASLGRTGHYTDHPDVVTVHTRQPRTRHQKDQFYDQQIGLRFDYMNYDLKRESKRENDYKFERDRFDQQHVTPYAMIQQRQLTGRPPRGYIADDPEPTADGNTEWYLRGTNMLLQPRL
jgi:hypothetical protein